MSDENEYRYLIWSQAAKVTQWIDNGYDCAETQLFSGELIYTRDGMLHCLHGPAIIDGPNVQYWVNGHQYTKCAFDFLFPQ